MSHHFDTKQAQENPSLNICDMYLFKGAPGTVTMAMTVNADAGISSPDILPLEALYCFRFDVNYDAREEVVLKIRFGEPKHADADETIHVQPFRVLRAEGDQIPGDAGDIVLEGETGTARTQSGVTAFVGVSPELWAADAMAFFNLLTRLYKEDRFDPEVFLHRENYFHTRNTMAMVLEVPIGVIGQGKVHAWATASLYGHAPEVQISRWGLPLFTHLFLSDPEAQLAELFHAGRPEQDRERFTNAVAKFVSKLSSRAGLTDEPDEYGRRIASRLCPAILPYELGTEASFSVGGFNGRPLGADAYDIMLTLAANRAISDGVSPDRSRILETFPYYGEKYSKSEQKDLRPISRGFYES
jgi:hypothetical protein